MKKLVSFITIVLISIILFSGCNKEKKTQKNYLKIGETVYELGSGIIENFGSDTSWHEGFNLDLYLISKGINISTGEDEDIIASGSGQFVYFEMFSNDSLALHNGNYEYSEAETLHTGTFDDAEYITNWSNNEEEEENWNEASIVSGTVNVNQENNLYNISFDCTDEQGKSVTGHYEGTLLYLNYGNDNKSVKPSKSKIKSFRF